jgi:ABC-type multidrug transport system fused ATPase/permease subunit
MEAQVSTVDNRKRKRLPLRDRIEINQLTFTYPKAECPALVDISRTGAGKTTLVDLVLGLLEMQRGEIRIDGTRLTVENVRDWQQAIGYVPQAVFLIDDTVAANIAFGVAAHKIDMHTVEQVSRMAALQC